MRVRPNIKIRLRQAGMCVVALLGIMGLVYTSDVLRILNDGVIIAHNHADIGQCTLGSAVKHDFDIWNVSFKQVKIMQVAPTCNCSVSSVSNFEIPPFHRSRVTLKVNTSLLTPGRDIKGVAITFENGMKLSAAFALRVIPKGKQ